MPIPLIAPRDQEATSVSGETDVVLEPGKRTGRDRLPALAFDRQQSCAKVDQEVHLSPANIAPVECARAFAMVKETLLELREQKVLDRVVRDIDDVLNVSAVEIEQSKSYLDAVDYPPGALWDPNNGEVEGGQNYGSDCA